MPPMSLSIARFLPTSRGCVYLSWAISTWQLARLGRGALSEDVQNKLCSVEHFALGDFRKAVELSGREFAVEDDQRGLAL